MSKTKYKIQLIILAIILFGCASPKVFRITKPTNEREWRAFNWVDSAVCKLLGFDSTTYDWDKKIQYDWKDGKPIIHKFKLINQ